MVVCIIDHYPLGNLRTEISGGLKSSEKHPILPLTPILISRQFKPYYSHKPLERKVSLSSKNSN